MTSLGLQFLPRGSGFPRGWWLTTQSFTCTCQPGFRGHRIQKGVAVWLSGKDGDVWCMLHAVRRGIHLPPLERTS